MLFTREELPWWLNDEAVNFLMAHSTVPEKGIYRFGKDITIPPGVGGDWYPGDMRTKEQIIWINSPYIQPLAYKPIDRSSYRTTTLYKAAMEWNRDVYYFVEVKNFRPSDAIQKLITLNHELERQLVMDFSKLAVDRGLKLKLAIGKDAFLSVYNLMRSLR